MSEIWNRIIRASYFILSGFLVNVAWYYIMRFTLIGTKIVNTQTDNILVFFVSKEILYRFLEKNSALLFPFFCRTLHERIFRSKMNLNHIFDVLFCSKNTKTGLLNETFQLVLTLRHKNGTIVQIFTFLTFLRSEMTNQNNCFVFTCAWVLKSEMWQEKSIYHDKSW